jgi:hypothetical protein
MWLFEGRQFTSEDAANYYGFVYEIVNLTNNKKYIGRKYFTKAAYKQVKGKRKKIRKESDWDDYYGSSPSLKKDVEELGAENFKRTILKLCKTRGETNYYEAKYLFEKEVLERDDYYNEWISCKIGKTSVKKKLT